MAINYNNFDVKAIETALINKSARSAWERGVKAYAFDMLDTVAEHIEYSKDVPHTEEQLRLCVLNGAEDWKHYSESGCALCYDGQIAERLCTASELKKTRHGINNPNGVETWINVQSRALVQAWILVRNTAFAMFA